MSMYRKTVVLSSNVSQAEEVVSVNRLPISKPTNTWFYIPKDKKTVQPKTVPVDRNVSERTARRIIRQIQNIPNLRGYEILCVDEGKLYTNRKQFYGSGAKIVK